jgi:hypothetical protein
MDPRNRFKGINSASLCCLAGRYDNPIPTLFLDTIDRFKIPALNTQSGSNGKLVSSYWLKFAALRLFVETMPIYEVVVTRNRINEFEQRNGTFKLAITLDRHNARL